MYNLLLLILSMLMPPKIELGTKAKKAQLKLAKKKSNSTRSRQEFVTHRELAGYRFNPGHDIPPIDQIPWNRLNLVSMHKGVTDTTHLKASEVANAIVTQLDGSGRVFCDTPYFDIKISSIRAWAITGTSLAMTIYDWSSNVDVTTSTATEEVLAEIIDNKTDVVPAIGYMIPEPLKHVVITNAISKPQIVCSFLATSGSDVMVLFNLSWKPNGPQKLLYTGPSLMNTVTSIRKDIRKTTQLLNNVRHPATDAIQVAPSTDQDRLPAFQNYITNSALHPVPVIGLPLEERLSTFEKQILDMKTTLENLISITGIRRELATPTSTRSSVKSPFEEP